MGVVVRVSRDFPITVTSKMGGDYCDGDLVIKIPRRKNIDSLISCAKPLFQERKRCLQSSSGTLPDFVEEGLRVINMAQEEGILLRLMGATAIMVHCSKYRYLFGSLGRSLTDLDFMTYGKFRKKLEKFFVRLGYAPDKRTLYHHGDTRHKYFDNRNHRAVDVFFDELAFSHTVNLEDRLELDSPTITLSDLLLEKMQIVQINEKDIKDTVIMLREHEIQNGEEEVINARFIARTLADDWGFCYTVTTNLDKAKRFLNLFSALTVEDRQDVRSKIDALLKTIEDEPKSMKWQMRAKIGLRKKWYTEVEEFKN